MREWLTVTEVAGYLGVSNTAVRVNYIATGQLPAEKSGRVYLVHKDDLRKFKRRKRPHGVHIEKR